MGRKGKTVEVSCSRSTAGEPDAEVWDITFRTADGEAVGRFHPPVEKSSSHAAGVVWVGGAGGGLDGPARGLYPAACAILQAKGLAGLRLHYRYPNQLEDCVCDTLVAVEFLVQRGASRVGLVGHSFGGAVVINAGALSPAVKAVVPMSTQTYGTDLTPELSPRPLLLIHGTDDEILPDACSRRVYEQAREPKELCLLPGARHGLDEAREEVLKLLTAWLPEKLTCAA